MTHLTKPYASMACFPLAMLAASVGIATDTNKVTIIDRDLVVEELPLLTKYDVSNRILDRVKGLFRD